MLDSVGAATVATFWRLARREAVLNQHLQKARTPAIASGKVASRKHLIGERPVAVTSCRRCGRIEGESYAASEWVSGTPAAETAASVVVTFSGDADRRARCLPGPRHSEPAPRSDPSSCGGDRFPTERSGYRARV